MSVTDPKREHDHDAGAKRQGSSLTASSRSLSDGRGDAKPDEVERLVSLLSERGAPGDDRLAKALEGLSRWAESAKPGAATTEASSSEEAEIPSPVETAPIADAPVAERRSVDDQITSAPPIRTAEPLTVESARPVKAAPGAASEVEERLTAFARSLTEPSAPSLSDAVVRPSGKVGGKPAIASLRAALAEIAARQKALDAEHEAALPQASAQGVAALRAEIERLGRSIDELPRRPEIDGLIREMATLSARLGDVRGSGLDAQALKAIDSLVEDVDRVRGGAASPRMIATISAELRAVSDRLDALNPASAAAVDRLASRIEDLRVELESFPHMQAVKSLAHEIRSIVARLDAQEEASKLASAPIDGDAGATATAAPMPVAEAPSLGMMADLGRQIEMLTERLKERPQPAASVTAFKDLSGKVDAIDGKLSALVTAPEALDALNRQVASLFDDMAARGGLPAAGLETVTGRLDGLEGQVGEIAAQTRAGSASIDRVEEAVRQIADDLLSGRSAAAMDPHRIEAQVDRIVDGLDRHDGRIDDLNAAFAGLAARIEQSCATLGETASNAVRDAATAPAADSTGEIANALAELRAASTQAERRAADTLDSVRVTLERLLDRIESRADAPKITPPFAAPPAPSNATPAPAVSATDAARAAARRAMQETPDEQPQPLPTWLPEDAPKASADAEPDYGIDLGLAADMPIEPGAGRPEATVPQLGAQPTGAQTAASFIAAARRAATQATAEEALAATDAAAPRTASEIVAPSRFTALFATLKARRRPIFVGVAASLVVLAALYAASRMTAADDVATAPNAESPVKDPAAEPVQPEEAAPATGAAPAEQAAPSTPAPAAEAPPAPVDAAPANPAPADPAPTPAAPPVDDRRSELSAPARPLAELTPPHAAAADLTDFAFGKAVGAAGRTKSDPDRTGSIGRAADVLPDAIGSATLRMRAVSGDPSAQLEIADRLIAGRAGAPNPALAAVWLEKAASQGLAPAQHRLGSLYEKGSGVVRDVQTARRWYERAAASGNVRAMHNLGVMQAEGSLGKPDFSAAAVWFRMSAERGLVDSQYNLAVLDARGLNGKRDLVEAYKWFALAATQGDRDAATKRDEIAKALGADLPAAKAALDAFRPRAIDAAANDAPTPPGGWDAVASTKTGTR